MTRAEILKLHNSRNYKITNSLGVYDIYKYIRKHKWYNIGCPVTEKQFYAIIRQVNLLLIDKLINEGEIKLPKRMGKLELRKVKNEAKFVNGKLIVNYPIDWNKTIDLWIKDSNAQKQKLLIRDTSRHYSFYVYYNKRKANYNNKSFMYFQPNRNIPLAVKKRQEKGLMDAYSKK